MALPQGAHSAGADPDPERLADARLRPLPGQADARRRRSRSGRTSSATATRSSRAAVRYRRGRDDARGCEAPLEHDEPDRWRGVFAPTALGRWQFAIEAWVDRVASWRHELERKVEAGQEDLAERARRGRGAARRRRRSPSSEALADTTRGPVREVDARRAARGRRRPRARPLRRLVRALPALVGRVRGRGARRCRSSPSSASTSSTCRRSTRSGTPTARARTTRSSPRPAIPGSPWAIGSRGGRPHRRRTPSSARSPTSSASSHARAELGVEIALDFAIQCSPDHPWLSEHPEWFHRRPDGTLKYAENPPKRYQDIYNVNFDVRGLARALEGAPRRRPLLGRARRPRLPRRQPAHEAARVLGVADPRGARACTPRSSSSPRPSRARRGWRRSRRPASPSRTRTSRGRTRSGS